MTRHSLVPMAAVLLIWIVSGCSSREEAFSEKQWEKQVEATRAEDLYAANSRDNRFFAPWMEMNDKRFLDVVLWKLFPENEYTREEKKYLPRVVPWVMERLLAFEGDFILWIGHNTFLLRIGKPEPLKHEITGCWSRRIDRE